MTFGKRLKKLRTEREWTQETVSRQLKVVRSTYAYYESGKTYPDYETLSVLAKMYGVTIDYLVNGEPDTNNMQNEQQQKMNAVVQKNIKMDYKGLSPEEAALLSSYRAMDCHSRVIIMEISHKMAYTDSRFKKTI